MIDARGHIVIPLSCRDWLLHANKHARPQFNGEWISSNRDMMHFAMHRHAKGINITFFDGSASHVQVRKLWKLQWHQNYNVNDARTANAAYFPTWTKQLLVFLIFQLLSEVPSLAALRRLAILNDMVKENLLIVHVHVRVKAECVDAFEKATVENARQSIQEPGIARFDVIQQSEDPTRFVLVEVYRTADAPAAHKETAHYKVWRDSVAPMMAEPRSGVKFTNIFPENESW